MQHTIISVLTLDLGKFGLEAQLEVTVTTVWIPLVGFWIPVSLWLLCRQCCLEGSWVLCFTQNTCSLLPPHEPGWLLSGLHSETVFKGKLLSVVPVDLEYLTDATALAAGVATIVCKDRRGKGTV